MEKQFKLAASAACVAGPALTTLSILGTFGIVQFGEAALRMAPVGAMLGFVVFVIGLVLRRI